PSYSSVCMKNETAALIRDASVFFGNLDVGKGSIVPGGLGFYHGVPVLVPEKAKVTWTTLDGNQHEQEVEVKRFMPSRMTDVTIFFVIKKDGSVLVKALTKEEKHEHKYPYGDN